jgi:hypothetical protein
MWYSGSDPGGAPSVGEAVNTPEPPG